MRRSLTIHIRLEVGRRGEVLIGNIVVVRVILYWNCSRDPTGAVRLLRDDILMPVVAVRRK